MKRLAVVDLETDPFAYGAEVRPFACGFYTTEKYVEFWGTDCVEKFVGYLAEETERGNQYTIYAHNGGRFDYFFMLPFLNRNLRIVNSRIIQAYIGKHELRDSFAIMPFALAKYQKTEIDYSKFVLDKREQHKREILDYLRDDCKDLFTLVDSFVKEFGDALTIGSASMRELKKFHKFATVDKEYDERLRKPYYFGGRNQVFESGILHGKFEVYDVNSMYPSAMKNFLHPVSSCIFRDTVINDRTCFLSVEGENDGAFPVRQKDGTLDFNVPRGTFHTSIHEYNVALETGAFRPHRIIETLGWSRRESFAEFVVHFYDARKHAKAHGDKIKTLFYKFVMNSAYGKFAINPENFCDWYITPMGEFPPDYHQCKKGCDEPCKKKWTLTFEHCNEYQIWSRPLKQLYYLNIATGASITAASRAVLLHGLRHATRPIYCDTDSIICERLSDVPLSDTELGAWKLEAEGDTVAMAGKKMYAIFSDGKCIKKAHKGARLTGDEVLRIAKGETVESCNPVPSFKFDGAQKFTKRRIKKTACI